MPGERWTKDQLDTLLHQLRVERKSLPQLHVPGKSPAAVNNKRRRLKQAGWLDEVFADRRLEPWTIRELKQLTRLTQEYEFSAAFIAQLQLIPGRTVHAVGKMMARHGLGNPGVKQRARSACRLTAGQRDQLQHFLANEARLLPGVCVAAQWGLSPKTIATYRRRLGVPLSWDEARSSNDYQLDQQKRGRAFSEQLYGRWAEWRVAREQRLHALKQALQRSPSPPPSRSCCVCGEQWFALKDFFHVTSKRGGTSVSMSQTCRL